MAAGVPVVASRIGGIPDIIRDHENGLLVPPQNQKKLAEAIIYLLRNDNLRKKLGSNSLKLAKNYNWSEIAEKTISLYKEIGLKRNFVHSNYMR
jgi:glycosyltransferase involved in cell wall biosynthesis